MKGGCAVLEGSRKCGRTTVLAAIAIFLVDCGFNVFLVGPSNASVDALARGTSKLDPDNDYVRVRPANVESMALKTANPADNRNPNSKSKPENKIPKRTISWLGLSIHTKKDCPGRQRETQSIVFWHMCEESAATRLTRKKNS